MAHLGFYCELPWHIYNACHLECIKAKIHWIPISLLIKEVCDYSGKDSCPHFHPDPYGIL